MRVKIRNELDVIGKKITSGTMHVLGSTKGPERAQTGLVHCVHDSLNTHD